MPVLIVESNADRGALWREQLERTGFKTVSAQDQSAAVKVLQTRAVRLILMDLDLAEGSAIAVADFASYRQPGVKVILLTGTGLFSDGSIFRHAANVCAFLPVSTPPEDLAAVVEYHAPPPEPRPDVAARTQGNTPS